VLPLLQAEAEAAAVERLITGPFSSWGCGSQVRGVQPAARLVAAPCTEVSHARLAFERRLYILAGTERRERASTLAASIE